MSKIKIDKKDLRILEILDKNTNATISRIAKEVELSRQVAEYRLKKLISQKTIYACYTLIDMGRLGYSSFRIHIRIKNVNQERYSSFAKYLFNNYLTFWVGFVSGTFDIIVDTFAKNANDFEKMLSKIVSTHKDIIQGYETLVILNLDLYEYGNFASLNRNRSEVRVHSHIEENLIDELDKKILLQIKLDSRKPFESIGKEVGLTRNAVKSRIKNLERKKIIVGYKPLVNFNHFGRQSFKIFIRYNNSKIEEEQKLLEEIRCTPGILNTLKFVGGSWNLDIEIQVSNVRELQEFMIKLRNDYEIIEDYKYIQLIDDYGIDFFPMAV